MAAPQITDRAHRYRKNIFGFGGKAAAPAPTRKRRIGGLSIREAGTAAMKAGRRSKDLSDFQSWLEAKRLDDRSDEFISRVRDSYKRGVDAAEAEEENKAFLKRKAEQAREAARQKLADAREAARYRREFERDERTPRKAKEKAAPSYSSVPDEAAIAAGFKRGLTLNEILRGNPALRKKQKANPGAFARMLKKMNPAAASAEVFEDFHGHKPNEEVIITKTVHHHEHLASLGELISLEVWGIDKQGHTIKGFKKALLCSNEDRNQLFVEGGDQRINLADYGIRKEHETETLGQVLSIVYFTNKTHLGEEGGKAPYAHKFRQVNQDGRHVTIKPARYPDLIYDVRNEQLLFSGGSYKILREGINK